MFKVRDPIKREPPMTEIVNVQNFLLSIRETGYRSFAHTIAELVDNSLQAGANRVSISIDTGEISVTDNGTGMPREVLRRALQFGGSSRYGDRSGSGRFGMGLPTSSITLARRVDVYTRKAKMALHTYLDLDELGASENARIPEPTKIRERRCLPIPGQGTCVVLSRCDRTDKLRDVARLAQMKFELSRIFRYALQQGFMLEVNDDRLLPFDPLFLQTQHLETSAVQYGPPLDYQVPVQGRSGLVQVRFSQLPVAAWRELPNSVKQSLGISRGAGVSVVRAGREIAYGWYFLGTKRRENYDDWWRCEVKFDPELDEHFGVNHTKQQISPSRDLDLLLTPDIEHIGRTLNARIRQEFVRTAKRKSPLAARTATANDRYLPVLIGRHKKPVQKVSYRIEIDAEMLENGFYRTEIKGSDVVVYLNASHPVTTLYRAAKSGTAGNVEAFEYLILAAARAELAASSNRARWWYRQFRADWSDTLATFLGN
jgi:Histidine kinase-, DNA gyrase B-, and HSP90-like ATPase